MDFDICQDFSGDDYDEEAVETYTEELFGRFVQSPEAAALDAEEDDFDGFFWSNPLIQYGIDYRSVTPATMRPADFEEVLFRVFPRKVSVDASKAEEIVIELRSSGGSSSANSGSRTLPSACPSSTTAPSRSCDGSSRTPATSGWRSPFSRRARRWAST